MTTQYSEGRRCVATKPLKAFAALPFLCLLLSHKTQLIARRYLYPYLYSVSVNEHAQDTIWDGMQVMAILDRIKQQDAGKIEPPAIALSGMVGANPASEGFMEQNASASRRQIQRAAAEADEEDGEVKEVWPHGSPEPNLPIMWETGPLTLTSAGNLSKYPSVHQLQRLRGVETAWVHKIG